MTTLERGPTVLLRRLARYVCALLVAAPGGAALFAQHGHGSEGVGTAHMETRALRLCRPSSIAPWRSSITSGTRAP